MSTSQRSLSPPNSEKFELKRFPFALAALGYLLSVVWLLWRTWIIDHWQQLYSIDDPYIHLAIAKNLRIHAFYGVTQYHFSPASSSVIWPFLLAFLMFIFGVKSWISYALNVALSILLLYLVNRWLAEDDQPSWLRVASATGTALLVPLASLTTIGLEHILQTLSFLGLLFAAKRYCTNPTHVSLGVMAFWALLATSARYELAFAVAAVCVITAYLRGYKFLDMLFVGLSGLIPIIAFGLFSSLHQGAHFLPNSLLWKTHLGTQSLGARIHFASTNIHYFATHLLLVPLLAMVLLTAISIKRSRRLTPRSGLSLAVLVTCLLQCIFAATGQAGRYEAFLVAGMLAALATLLRELMDAPRIGTNWVPIMLAAIGVVALIPRAYVATTYAPDAIQQIYFQQYQMARFFASELPNSPAATNDIGAVDFYTQSANFDMVGLASTEVLNAVLGGTYDASKIQQLTDDAGVRVVAIYRSWFGDLPRRWVYVGSFTPRCPGPHFTVGGVNINVYATHEEDALPFGEKLAHFAKSLPVGVELSQNPDSTFCLH